LVNSPDYQSNNFRAKKSMIPFTALHQLVSVIPMKSRDLIPRELQPLYDMDSMIRDIFPKSFKIELGGKDADWMGVAIIPFVDRRRIFDAVGQMKFTSQRAKLWTPQKDLKVYRREEEMEKDYRIQAAKDNEKYLKLVEEKRSSFVPREKQEFRENRENRGRGRGFVKREFQPSENKSFESRGRGFVKREFQPSENKIFESRGRGQQQKTKEFREVKEIPKPTPIKREAEVPFQQMEQESSEDLDELLAAGISIGKGTTNFSFQRPAGVSFISTNLPVKPVDVPVIRLREEPVVRSREAPVIRSREEPIVRSRNEPSLLASVEPFVPRSREEPIVRSRNEPIRSAPILDINKKVTTRKQI